MHKTKFLFGVLAALCFMAFSASAASAQGIGGTNAPTFAGSPDFNFSNAGVGSHTFTGGGLTVTCTTVSAPGEVDTAGPLDPHGHYRRATFNIAFSGCTANIAGLNFPATVVPNCTWAATINPGTVGPPYSPSPGFNTATGASTGTVSTGNWNGCAGATVINLTGSNCVISVAPVTVAGTGQNLTAANTNSPANGAPAGMRLSVNAGGIPFTTANCPIGPGTATYTGTVRDTTAPSIWVIN